MLKLLVRFKSYFLMTCLVTCLIAFTSKVQSQENQSQAQLIIYIEGVSNVDMDVSLDLERISVVSSSDTIPITPSIKRLNSFDLSGNQILIAETFLTPNNYTSLILNFDNITSFAGKAKIHPKSDSAGLVIPINLQLLSNESSVLFLEWNPKLNEYVNELYVPNLKLLQHSIPPVGSVAYVTNENSGNISVIDMYKSKIVDVIKVGEKPRDLVFSQINQLLYVANSASKTISIVDPDLGRVVRTIELSFQESPERILLSTFEDK